MEKGLAITLATFKKALTHKNLKIVYGTDAVAGAHGRNYEEFIVRVRDGGQDPMAALESATSISAESMNMQDQIGSLAPGMQADIVGFDGNPLQDVTAARRAVFVMKAGKVYENRSTRPLNRAAGFRPGFATLLLACAPVFAQEHAVVLKAGVLLDGKGGVERNAWHRRRRRKDPQDRLLPARGHLRFDRPHGDARPHRHARPPRVALRKRRQAGHPRGFAGLGHGIRAGERLCRSHGRNHHPAERRQPHRSRGARSHQPRRAARSARAHLLAADFRHPLDARPDPRADPATEGRWRRPDQDLRLEKLSRRRRADTQRRTDHGRLRRSQCSSTSGRWSTCTVRPPS